MLGANNEFIRISNLSQMGACEHRFVDSVNGRLYATTAMKTGTVMHYGLAMMQERLSQEQIVEKMKRGEEFHATEIFIRDYVLKLTGRIDSLYVHARRSGGRSDCIVIDHKYPKTPYTSIPTYYSIQLVAYVEALEHSSVYGSICRVVGAQLVSREKETHSVTSSVDMRADELSACRSHMGELADRAWKLKRGTEEPTHRRFDICSGRWLKCYCKNVD